MIRHAVGCMTGTSLDGIDAALVAIDGEGLAMRARFVRGASRALGPVGAVLRRIAEQQPMAARDIAAAMRDFALLHAGVVADLLAGAACDLVAVHGQTVVHAPPVSWQLFQPAPLAQALGVPVVCDLRAADLARGGQGAPITPLSDWILFRDAASTRVVVNLGGFCNLTVLPAGAGVAGVLGRDVCACNQALDHIARRAFAAPYDADGQRALAGRPDAALVTRIAAALEAQAGGRRSLGTGDELNAAIDGALAGHRGEDVARATCIALVRTIHRAGGEGSYVLAGGGVRNKALRAEFAAAGASLTGDDLGVPAGFREAIAMAVLGALSRDRVAITLPQVTGVAAPAPVAGCWTFP
jgi:anhydro-N-acetylmuramic acid kinase